MSNFTLPEFPDPQFDEYVDQVRLVPGDVATLRIVAKSFTTVYIYKVRSMEPEVTKDVSHG